MAKVTGRSAPRAGVRLTPSQKAEAAALWRSGEVTLEELAYRFKKRPETFSRLFKDMGIAKGEAAREHQAKVTAAVEAKLLSDSEQVAIRISKLKESHLKYADGIAKLVWAELVEAKQKGKPLESIKGAMQSLQLAAATISKVREEVYVLLQVEKRDNEVDEDELPELTVRELTQNEVDHLQATTSQDDLGVNDDVVELGDDDDDEEIPQQRQSPPEGQG